MPCTLAAGGGKSQGRRAGGQRRAQPAGVQEVEAAKRQGRRQRWRQLAQPLQLHRGQGRSGRKELGDECRSGWQQVQYCSFCGYGLMFCVFAGQFAVIALKTQSAKFAAQLEK